MVESAGTVSNSASNPGLARGVLADVGHDRLTLEIPGTSYQLHLAIYQPPRAAVGKRLIGTIRAQARRVDVVDTGGKYVEPVYGRPRRVQGEVIATSDADQTITVDAGVPIVCKLTDARQKAADFARGAFVSFDVLPGATFTQAT